MAFAGRARGGRASNTDRTLKREPVGLPSGDAGALVNASPEPGLVSAVIPYLGDTDMFRSCLAGLSSQKRTRLEVIVIDNGSGDPALDPGLDEFERHLVIRNDRNQGFARAVNQGFQASGGEFLLVLNSDAVLASDYLERCLAILNQDESNAGVSGKLLKLNAGQLIDSTGHVLFGDRRVKDRGEWEEDRGQFDRDEEVFSFPATAAVYRVRALDDLEEMHGEVFDEDFFAYGEDVDIAWRLRLRGWKLRYAAAAVARHRRAVSADRTPTSILVWDQRNRYLRMVKNDSPGSFLGHGWEIVFTELRLFLYFLLRRPVVPFLAWAGFIRRLPRALRKRRAIQASRKVHWRDLEPWFQRYNYWGFLTRLRSPSRSDSDDSVN